MHSKSDVNENDEDVDDVDDDEKIDDPPFLMDHFQDKLAALINSTSRK